MFTRLLRRDPQRDGPQVNLLVGLDARKNEEDSWRGGERESGGLQEGRERLYVVGPMCACFSPSGRRSIGHERGEDLFLDGGKGSARASPNYRLLWACLMTAAPSLSPHLATARLIARLGRKGK